MKISTSPLEIGPTSSLRSGDFTRISDQIPSTLGLFGSDCRATIVASMVGRIANPVSFWSGLSIRGKLQSFHKLGGVNWKRLSSNPQSTNMRLKEIKILRIVQI